MWTLDHVGESQRGGDTKQEIDIPITWALQKE